MIASLSCGVLGRNHFAEQQAQLRANNRVPRFESTRLQLK
jgi:hypothetical protein